MGDITSAAQPDTGHIPIVFSCSDYFARFACVAISSVVAHTSLDHYYDIVILHTDISPKTQEVMMETFSLKPNVRLRFLSLKGELPDIPSPDHIHVSVETYYRLIAHKIFSQYDKIIYLDSDLLVCRDIAELMEISLGDCLLAAARDPDHAGLYRGNVGGVRGYTNSRLKLPDPYSYFQAGILLMNIRALRRAFGDEELLQKAREAPYMFVDQDILNVACNGHVYNLDMRWNVMAGYHRKKYIIPLAPISIQHEYEQARQDPWIIHYAGAKKPWHFPQDDYSIIFWEHASKTPFYNAIWEGYEQSASDYRKKRGLFAAKAIAREIKFGILRIINRG